MVSTQRVKGQRNGTLKHQPQKSSEDGNTMVAVYNQRKFC